MIDTSNMKVIATHHAKARLEQLNLPFRKAVYMFHNGVEEEAPHKDMKNEKYAADQQEARYRSYGTTLFTYKIADTKYKGAEEKVEPFVLFITVADKRAAKTYARNTPREDM